MVSELAAPVAKAAALEAADAAEPVAEVEAEVAQENKAPADVHNRHATVRQPHAKQCGFLAQKTRLLLPFGH